MCIFVFITTTATTAVVVGFLLLFLGHGSVWWFGVKSGASVTFCSFTFSTNEKEKWFFFCEPVVLWCGKWRVLLFLRWILEMRKGRVVSRKLIHGAFEKSGLFLTFDTRVSWRGSS